MIVVDCYPRVMLLLGGRGLHLSLVLRAVQASVGLLRSAVLPGRLVMPAVLRLVQMLGLKHVGGGRGRYLVKVN